MKTESKMNFKKNSEYINQFEFHEFLNASIFLIGFIVFNLIVPKNIIPSGLFEIFNVMIIILFALWLVYFLIIINKIMFNTQISVNNNLLVINVLLFCFFFLEFKESNLNSISYTLSLIISTFCIRYIFFRVCFWFQKREMDENLKLFRASYKSYLVLYVVYFSMFCYPSTKLLQVSIFLMILVYGFYDLVKVKYLFLSPKYSEKNGNMHISFFNEIKGIDMYAWLIVLIMFLLYNYQIFNISECQTLYYFHSAVSQIFAAILGIVSMFGILILQKNDNKNKIKNNIIKNGIKGFLIIYISVIILSVTGILVSSNITFESTSSITWNLDISSTRALINSTIFELSLLMTPTALLYLYAMIVNFLKLDDTKGNISQANLDDY